MRRLSISAALFLVAATGACAPVAQPPEGLVWLALSEINEFYTDPDDPVNRPGVVRTVPKGMLSEVDISHDGKPDWLMDFDKAVIGAFCGTGGCPKRLYVSTEDGYVRAFDQQVLDLTLSTVGGETRVEAWVHDTFCDNGGAECRFAWTWDPAARRLAERPASDGRTVLNGGGFSPLDENPENTVGVIADWARAERQVCALPDDSGFDKREAVLSSIADVNGDGLRDWLGFPSTPCDNTPRPGFLVWASAEAGAFRLAYESASDRMALLDISTRPATLSERPQCEDGKPCEARALTWDRAGGRLIAGAAR